MRDLLRVISPLDLEPVVAPERRYIFGAVGDPRVEAKRVVLERIIADHRLAGPQFVTFGDGPVESRETRKRDGVAVGVASDEVRRFGLNAEKRTRLIRAGADLIVPDFSQLDLLLHTLFQDNDMTAPQPPPPV